MQNELQTTFAGLVMQTVNCKTLCLITENSQIRHKVIMHSYIGSQIDHGTYHTLNLLIQWTILPFPYIRPDLHLLTSDNLGDRLLNI